MSLSGVDAYVLWTDAAMDRFVLDFFDCTSLSYVWRFLATAKNGATLGEVVKRADMIRFLLLIVYGGIYADLDIAPNAVDVTALQRQQVIVEKDVVVKE
jgi:mannosyltransferase OCH1-like enzyme